jgi:hypothetical protein
MKEIRTSKLDTTYIRLALCSACFLQYVFAVPVSRFLRYNLHRAILSVDFCLLGVTWLYRQGRWSLIAVLSVPHVAVSSLKKGLLSPTPLHILLETLARQQNCTKVTPAHTPLLSSSFLSCMSLFSIAGHSTKTLRVQALH